MTTTRVLACALLSSLTLGAASASAAITTYSDRTAFNIAVGPTVTEDFTPTFHFPISTGVLNSATNLPGIGIVPGTIQPGVTYSTAIWTGNFFNIDASFAAGFAGGFLDSIAGIGPLHIAFDAPATAFGFDSNSFMGPTFSLTIHFSDAPDLVIGPTVLPNSPTLGFFGYQSGTANITGADILGADRFFPFAIDNFSFTAGAAVPEPATMALLGAGLLGLAAARRRR